MCRQRVTISGHCLSWAPVLSGIPQGSVIGPLMFICYVNDMPVVLHSTIGMFADDTKIFHQVQNIDTKIFHQVQNIEDSDILKSDLKRLQFWADIWQLRFNAMKCKVMH